MGTRKFFKGDWETGRTKYKQIIPCLPERVVYEISNMIIDSTHGNWKKTNRYIDMLYKRTCPIRQFKKK